MDKFADSRICPMPESKTEWEWLKDLFLNKFGVEDTPETWTFIISQIQNVKMPELTFMPETIHAHYKRWKIAKVLQDEKTVYITQLQDKLNALLAKGDEVNGSLPDGTPEPQSEVPPLQIPSEELVSVS